VTGDRRTLILSRRDLLGGAIALPFWRTMSQSAGKSPHTFVSIRDARGVVVPAGNADISRVELTRQWTNELCRSHVTNRGTDAAAIKEIVLADLTLDFPPSTPIYGEGFQMLSQNGGTLGSPKDLGSYTDAKHYKIPMAPGTAQFYGAVTFSTGSPTPPSVPTEPVSPKPRSAEGGAWVAAFTSCRRFSGVFRLEPPSSLQIVVDTEGLTLRPGESWELEELLVAAGLTRDGLLEHVGLQIAANHPRLKSPAPPTGWCSWYCFGPRVTAQQVLDTLDAIAKKVPGLTYIQIDDGYQPAMGDWLETGAAFGGDVRGVLDQIKKRGYQPAIWVAPFIAEEQSHVFQQHRDWFVKDSAGAPLRSDLVTFGGWRRGPWYVLDGTRPEVHAHFEHVFNTMRQEWGCTYFKLDANFWGAIHGGRFHDPDATRIEAYRRGMQAILRGAGDSFILGCNHPIWPSLGLIHGSRSSNDIKRSWDRVKTTAQQNLLRNWQNGRLWWNDPDAVVLTGDLTDDEFRFHATAIYATGGMVLSGDDLTVMPEPRLRMLKKLVPPTGVAATFDGDSLDVGTVVLPGRTAICLFNWDDGPILFRPVTLPVLARVRDFWTDELLEGGRPTRTIRIGDLARRCARLLICEHV
jgi:alpha-galactosidase